MTQGSYNVKMISHIIDDLFDKDFVSDLESILIHEVPVTANNVANSHRLFGTNILARSSINRVEYLHSKAAKFFDAFDIIEDQFSSPIYLKRIDVNLQFIGMNGSTHTDAIDDELTVMLMNNSEWKPEWGGQFQLMDWRENVIEEHDYVPGRVIIFPGKYPHRGLAPLSPHIARYTTVYRIIPEEKS